MTLTYTPEVAEARAQGQPIVALESTIITHGMPYPQNLETAQMVETAVREAGATPATISIAEGEIRIGQSTAQLETLAQTTDAMKLSRADLAVALATGRTGATTVAATMICAARGGIQVFATGGIGGVHRGAEDSFDISADLLELAQTPVCVVAAGPKAILDLPKTLEVLETHGVPVIAYGQDQLPAFWSRESGLPCPLRLDTAVDLAAAFAQRMALSIPGGQLVVNPIPPEDEIPAATLAPLITEALTEAEASGISGKDVTPYLLDRIFALTEGRSLTANIALVLNNARLAARIAAALPGSDVATQGPHA
ncbi:MAG: pseudouridine-5'-phosphate glycosidase [Pseudomonadota bacterium]